MTTRFNTTTAVITLSAALLACRTAVCAEEPAATLADGTGAVHCVAFSPDGKLLAAASEQRVRIWDASTWREAQSFAPETTVLSIAFSPDGKLLACGGKDGSAGLWNLARRKTQHVFERPGGAVRAVAFAPDGKTFALARGERVLVYDLQGDKPTLLRDEVQNPRVNDIAFSPDGKRLAYTGRGDRTFRIFNVKNERSLQVLHSTSAEGWAVAFTGDGKRIVGGDGFHVIVMDVGKEEQSAVVYSHNGSNPDVRDVAVSAGDRLIASAAESDGYRLWDLKAARPVTLLKETGAFAVAFSPDGKWLATGGGKGVVKVWEVSMLSVKK